jgi:two-component system chemotaxis response regulator CheY
VKVLVADDDPVTRELLHRILCEAGYEVLLVDDGRLAWETFRETGVSVVITDWEMPGLNGIELCSRIRQHDTAGYTYIIFLTSRAGRDHLIEGLSAGADDFISKPLYPEELRVRLRVAQRILALEANLRRANRDLLRMNDRLLKMSRLDPLMEIGNRLAFEERFEEYHGKAREEGWRYAVVMCDVDNFKLCNDSFGHQLGDDVLREVASAIRQRLRADDAAFRYGGEEILMLLNRQDLAGAVAAAERIRASIEALEFSDPSGLQTFRVTVSCGVVCQPADDAAPLGRRELVEMADRALYQAKRCGRNRVVAAVSASGKVEYLAAREFLEGARLEAGTHPSQSHSDAAGTRPSCTAATGPSHRSPRPS